MGRGGGYWNVKKQMSNRRWLKSKGFKTDRVVESILANEPVYAETQRVVGEATGIFKRLNKALIIALASEA